MKDDTVAGDYDDKYFIDQQRHTHKLMELHHGFQFTHNLFLRKILKYKSRGRLLDFGCGRGYFLKIADKHFETYGIDISEYCINETNSNSPSSKTICGDSEKIKEFSNEFFDIITAIDVLEHMEDPGPIIDLFHKKLSTDGILLINIPNTESLGRKWKGENWFAYRDETHKSILSKKKWLRILKRGGFTVKKTLYDGLWDTPYVPKIPLQVQNLMIKIPMVVLVNFINLPEKFGENVCIICRKK